MLCWLRKDRDQFVATIPEDVLQFTSVNLSVYIWQKGLELN
jgi:hypothetical protein